MPSARFTSLVHGLLGLSLLASSCQIAPVLVEPQAEGTVVLGKNRSTVRIAGRTFHFDFKGEQPLSLMIGGRIIRVKQDGSVNLPPQLIEEAKKQGGFLVLNPAADGWR